jgi:hypothetical protein
MGGSVIEGLPERKRQPTQSQNCSIHLIPLNKTSSSSTRLDRDFCIEKPSSDVYDESPFPVITTNFGAAFANQHFYLLKIREDGGYQ